MQVSDQTFTTKKLKKKESKLNLDWIICTTDEQKATFLVEDRLIITLVTKKISPDTQSS